MKVDTTQGWADYQGPGYVSSDDQTLIAMLQEVVDTIHTIERIYGQKAALMVRGMHADYHALNNMAWHRGLKNIPTL